MTLCSWIKYIRPWGWPSPSDDVEIGSGSHADADEGHQGGLTLPAIMGPNGQPLDSQLVIALHHALLCQAGIDPAAHAL